MSLGYQVNHLARLLAHALRERIEPLGVVPGQFAQLLALHERDGLIQAELCERVQIEQPTMANTLARMQRDGLIERVPDPADGRRSLVLLTDRARRLEDELVGAARAVNATATQGLDDAQVAARCAGQAHTASGGAEPLVRNLPADAESPRDVLPRRPGRASSGDAFGGEIGREPLDGCDVVKQFEGIMALVLTRAAASSRPTSSTSSACTPAPGASTAGHICVT